MKKIPFFKHAAKYFEEYSEKTSIHGIKFFGDRSRSFIERLIWLIICTVSVTMCIIFVSKAYKKWETSPIYITVGTRQVPIHNVEFPAITICPELKSKRSIFYYSDALERAIDSKINMTRTERLLFEYMSMICNRSKDEDYFLEEEFDIDILYFLHGIAPNVSEVFVKCRFSSVEQDCEKIFTPLFTSNGVCFTFNILDRSELFQDNVQQFMNYHRAPKSACFKQPYTSDCTTIYPRRLLFSGPEIGLEVELKATAYDLDFKCVSALQGYKVIIHNPFEIPTRNHDYFRLPLNQAVSATLTPQVIAANEDNLRKYTAQQRQCYFDDEKQLLGFKHYSQSNCDIECLAYIMSNVLGCLDFYLPQINKTRSICGAKLLPSLRASEIFIMGLFSHSKDSSLPPVITSLKQLMKDYNETKDVNLHCNCLPSCSSVDYRFETTQTDYYWYEYENVEKGKRNEEYKSLMNIYFKESEYIPMQREEVFGTMDFIAYCGGLLGLFIGFSFVSLAEIIYFLTLRLGCNVRMYGRHLWYGKD